MRIAAQSATQTERQGTTTLIRVRGDLVIPTAQSLHDTLRPLGRRWRLKKVVLDFTSVGRLDSAGVAVIEIARRSLKRAGKELAFEGLGPRHRAALELAPKAAKAPVEHEAPASALEVVGENIFELGVAFRALVTLISEILHQVWLLLTRRARLPEGSVAAQVVTMGFDAVFIVGLLSFLLGTTIAFQGAIQLQRFGASVFVADMVSMSMVREFAPMMTAIVLTGRTGAAIAAELGTMRVGSEIDALASMGVSPVRFLVVPRLTALTLVQPALTVMGMFIGIGGGMLVASLLLDMSPMVFWMRIVQRLTISDFAQGIGKSFVFAWIIGIAGSHLGMRATGDASSVGKATTRAVVVGIFFIIVFDAVFATVLTLTGGA